MSDPFPKAMIEALAAAEHERWSHWQRYVHEQGTRLPDGTLLLPAELVDRWEKQIATPYDQLSETEKDSDREQLNRVLPILKRYWVRAVPRS